MDVPKTSTDTSCPGKRKLPTAYEHPIWCPWEQKARLNQLGAERFEELMRCYKARADEMKKRIAVLEAELARKEAALATSYGYLDAVEHHGPYELAALNEIKKASRPAEKDLVAVEKDYLTQLESEHGEYQEALDFLHLRMWFKGSLPRMVRALWERMDKTKEA